MRLDAIPQNASTESNDTSSKLSSESFDLHKLEHSSLKNLNANYKIAVEDGSSRNHDQSAENPNISRAVAAKSSSIDQNSKWVIPDLTKGENPRFGLKDGLQFGFYPGSLDNGNGGPRGLIRVWSPLLPNNQYSLANFIAVEPTAVGNPEKGLSELENSQGAGDWQPGKFMTVDPQSVHVSEISPGVEELSMTCDVEKFHNGSHVLLDISERSDQPEELHFKIHAAADSAPIDNCILTATWGNLTRSRELWLKDGMVNALEIPAYRDYRGYDFAPDQYFGPDRLTHFSDGSVGAALTTNEKHPDSLHPLFGTGAWYWGTGPITQYWKTENPDDSTHLRVNGRNKYWNSKWPAGHPDGVEIPGGTSFENFELRRHFYDGQEFTFGVSNKQPEDLGFGK